MPCRMHSPESQQVRATFGACMVNGVVHVNCLRCLHYQVDGCPIRATKTCYISGCLWTLQSYCPVQSRHLLLTGACHYESLQYFDTRFAGTLVAPPNLTVHPLLAGAVMRVRRRKQSCKTSPTAASRLPRCSRRWPLQKRPLQLLPMLLVTTWSAVIPRVPGQRADSVQRIDSIQSVVY